MMEGWLPWIAFNAFVLLLLALDLGLLHRHAHVISCREAMGWSLFWVGLALLFAVVVNYWMSLESSLQFLTGYLIEKSLSVDNIFVFALIFSYFRVPPQYQHRVLFWGIIGALLLRALMIALGASLLEQFHWIIYLFGGFLLLTGIRIVAKSEIGIHPERNPLVNLFKRMVPVTSQYAEGRFFVKQNGKRHATPLFLVLIMVESADIVFAVDSIPAIFAVADDPFIVYTSNVFAILGLRSLYFALADLIYRFHYLKFGLAIIMTFVGINMLLMDIYKIPVGFSLAFIFGVIVVAIVASMRYGPDQQSSGALKEE